MPQVIFASRTQSLHFRTFLMDFDYQDKDRFTWDVLFKTIHKKYGINLNVLRLYDKNNKSIDYKDIHKKSPFRVDDHKMYSTEGKECGDFWINFDIYPRRGEKLY